MFIPKELRWSTSRFTVPYVKKGNTKLVINPILKTTFLKSPASQRVEIVTIIYIVENGLQYRFFAERWPININIL